MSADLIHHRGLTLDVSGYKLLGCGRSEYLTSHQTRLLAVLMSDPNRVRSYQELATALTGGETLSEQALKVSISRIRRCLRLLGCTEDYLLSVRSMGYIFDPAHPMLHEEPRRCPS
nr:winged helix-turn-helix domain-containing protein [uncultured Sphingomonas sp.]